jgi:putative protease
MNILSPVNKKEEVEQLIKAGANELYCGVLSLEWKKRYTNTGCINRREWASCNFSNFRDLKETVDMAHSYNTPVFLTMNSPFYTTNQYPLILKEIKEAVGIGIDAFIITDVGLLLELKRNKINTNLHISSGATVFNSNTINFYKKLGASRIILPRHLTLGEIKELSVNKPDMDLEVFIFNDGCFNIDGFCTAQHGISEEYEKAVLLCRLPYKTSILFDNDKKDFRKERTIRSRISNLTANLTMECGACALYNFKKYGIASIKIIGRGKPTEKKVKDVSFFKQLLGYLEKDITKEEFVEKAKILYQRMYKGRCHFGMCYYPI